MKASMVIPTYWARPVLNGWSAGDEVYDHPTPLDTQGTLARTLESMKILRNKDFKLVIIVASTSDKIEAEAIEKVEEIVSSASTGIDTTIFESTRLKEIHSLLQEMGMEEYVDLLSLKGYSNIRNLCLFIPHLLSSDIAVLIDDDEIFEDADFTLKIWDFIGKEYKGKKVDAVAGYYLQPDGDYHIKKSSKTWMQHWGQHKVMNEAFDMVIGSEPRLKETPFVFGGNMVIHRNLFSKVPFDPGITRGEDIDYLINARMFGFDFFLDNQLSIKHLPPAKAHPSWMQLRQDIYRFIYEKAKIESQKKTIDMTKVFAEDLDPYPGFFLKKNLINRITQTCQLLSKEYQEEEDHYSSKQALKNISIAKTEVTKIRDPFNNLCRIQKRWQQLLESVKSIAVNY